MSWAEATAIVQKFQTHLEKMGNEALIGMRLSDDVQVQSYYKKIDSCISDPSKVCHHCVNISKLNNRWVFYLIQHIFSYKLKMVVYQSQWIIDIQERKLEKFFLVRLKWQRLSKSCQPLIKVEWLCTRMSSVPVVLHAGLSSNKTIRNERNRQWHL